MNTETQKSEAAKTKVLNSKPFEQTLAEIYGAVLRNEPMAAHTTFAVGGPADYFVSPTSAQQIQATIQAADEAEIPWWVIGCGRP